MASGLLYGINNPLRRKVVWPSSERMRLDYDSGLSCRQLAKKYSVGRKIVLRWFKTYHIALRTKSEAVRKTFELFPEKLDYRQSPEYKAALAVAMEEVRARPEFHETMSAGRQKALTPELRKQLSDWKKTTTLSAEGRAKVSAARKEFLADDANREPLRAAWRDPEKRAAMITKILRSLNCRPTRPEQKVIEAIAKYNLPYKYTGDGSFIVAGLNPDFVNTNGKKVAVEVFGDYWHGEGAKRVSATEEGRRAIFAEYGWDLVVLWEKDINRWSRNEIASVLNGP